MPMTVSELKEIVSIDITGITIDDLDSLTITYVDSLGDSTNVDDAGDYEVIDSKICGDTIDSKFVFIARGLGSNVLTYGNLQKVLNEADDTDLVYFLTNLQTLPSSAGSVKPVEGASLNIVRLSSVSDGGAQTSQGELILREVALPCSSSSSSSSSS
jgi:hypothetical protein